MQVLSQMESVFRRNHLGGSRGLVSGSLEPYLGLSKESVRYRLVN